MACRSISFSICVFVTVVTATNFTDRNSFKGSDPEVTVYSFQTGNPESSTVERDQEVNETTAVFLETPSETSKPSPGAHPPTPATADHGRPRAAAAPTAAVCSAPTLDNATVSLLQNLSRDEKNRRLFEAAKEGAVGDLRALLASGADVRARDSGLEWTALHWAAFWGHVEVVRCLVEAGAEVDARNDNEATPLHFAAGSDRVGVVRVLTASSADPNARDDEEQTPLHWAAERGYTDTVMALLEAGADKDARDVSGSSPLDLARANDHQQLVDILRSS